jgi:hypothetical protein
MRSHVLPLVKGASNESELRQQTIRLAHSNPAVREHLLPFLGQSKAAGRGKWYDVAAEELGAEEDVEVRVIRKERNFGVKYIEMAARGRGNSGESEWMVFEKWKDAEKYAYEYVKEMLEEEPGMFSQKWLKNYIEINKGDAQQIASEGADSYVDDLHGEDERLIEEAGMEDEWEDLDEEYTDLEDEMSDLDFESEDTEDASRKKAISKREGEIRERLKRIEAEKEDLVQSAAEQVRENYEEYELERMKDPMEYLSDLGYDLSEGLPGFVSINTDKAAKSALREDGVDHFLDRYDGDSIQLDSGAYAFGTN